MIYKPHNVKPRQKILTNSHIANLGILSNSRVHYPSPNAFSTVTINQIASFDIAV